MSGSVHPGFTKPQKRVKVPVQLTGKFEDGETEQMDNERDFLWFCSVRGPARRRSDRWFGPGTGAFFTRLLCFSG
jgi:hypothetical protein